MTSGMATPRQATWSTPPRSAAIVQASMKPRCVTPLSTASCRGDRTVDPTTARWRRPAMASASPATNRPGLAGGVPFPAASATNVATAGRAHLQRSGPTRRMTNNGSAAGVGAWRAGRRRAGSRPPSPGSPPAGHRRPCWRPGRWCRSGRTSGPGRVLGSGHDEAPRSDGRRERRLLTEPAEAVAEQHEREGPTLGFRGRKIGERLRREHDVFRRRHLGCSAPACRRWPAARRPHCRAPPGTRP